MNKIFSQFLEWCKTAEGITSYSTMVAIKYPLFRWRLTQGRDLDVLRSSFFEWTNSVIERGNVPLSLERTFDRLSLTSNISDPSYVLQDLLISCTVKLTYAAYYIIFSWQSTVELFLITEVYCAEITRY